MDAHCFEDAIEGGPEFGISVVQEIAAPAEETDFSQGEIAGHFPAFVDFRLLASHRFFRGIGRETKPGPRHSRRCAISRQALGELGVVVSSFAPL